MRTWRQGKSSKKLVRTNTVNRNHRSNRISFTHLFQTLRIVTDSKLVYSKQPEQVVGRIRERSNCSHVTGRKAARQDKNPVTHITPTVEISVRRDAAARFCSGMMREEEGRKEGGGGMEKHATATNCALLVRKDQEAEARMVKREDRTDE